MPTIDQRPSQTLTRFRVELEAAHDRLDREPVVRLRQALKVLGRSFGLRATAVVELPKIGLGNFAEPDLPEPESSVPACPPRP